MKVRENIFSILLMVWLLLSVATDWYSQLSVGLFIMLIVYMLNKLGKGIVLREIVALHTTFICLVMPSMGYSVFTKENQLARLWMRYMPIPEHDYFSFAMPAITGFVLALFWPSSGPENQDTGPFLNEILSRGKRIVQYKSSKGILLLSIGPVTLWAADRMPSGLEFVCRLFFFASFAGFLYVFYSKNLKFRTPLLWGFAAFILMTALNSGMFTVVAYMGLTIFSFLFLGRRTALWKKLMMFVLGAFILLLIQSVKPTYRKMTWAEGGYQGSRIGLFADLITDKLVHFEWSSADAFFPIYYRTNQGFNVALVMRRFPQVKPFDNGYNIAVSIASAFVPRLFWPDKPEAGGKFNMEYYTGFYISGWSTNVGPLGEAYGSFGQWGGILYMIFVGFFIRWCYRKALSVSKKIPLILFWFPVLFYQTTYSGETDSLQIFNSLIKAGFFIWLLYKLIPTWFVLKLEEVIKPNRPKSNASTVPFVQKADGSLL
ncbi:MAG: hypothetical protein JST68_01560 [Bacteroidetes bacterium]|nr:hypothetical protein [Bacteroidota bacterium]